MRLSVYELCKDQHAVCISFSFLEITITLNFVFVDKILFETIQTYPAIEQYITLVLLLRCKKWFYILSTGLRS